MLLAESERCQCMCADFSLEEEYLFGSLCITIDCLKGLKHSAGSTNLSEVHWKLICSSVIMCHLSVCLSVCLSCTMSSLWKSRPRDFGWSRCINVATQCCQCLCWEMSLLLDCFASCWCFTTSATPDICLPLCLTESKFVSDVRQCDVIGIRESCADLSCSHLCVHVSALSETSWSGWQSLLLLKLFVLSTGNINRVNSLRLDC